jgi:hypothetical protein
LSYHKRDLSFSCFIMKFHIMEMIVSWSLQITYFILPMCPAIKFFKNNGRQRSVRMVHKPPFWSSWQLHDLFSSQECGSHWCRWRPDCATFCPGSRWRHVKARRCGSFLNQSHSSCRCKGRFDCPSREYSSLKIYSQAIISIE